jgi:hypothetical protein
VSESKFAPGGDGKRSEAWEGKVVAEHEVPVRVSACRIYAEKGVSTHWMSSRESPPPPSPSSSVTPPNPPSYAPSYASHAAAMTLLTRWNAVCAGQRPA